MAENICSLLPVDLKNEPYEEYEESTRQQLSDDIDNASARVESVADELTNDVIVTMMSVKKQCEDTTVKNDNDNVKLNIKDAGDFESAETKETPVSRLLISERGKSPINYRYKRSPGRDASLKRIAPLTRLATTKREKLALDVNQVDKLLL